MVFTDQVLTATPFLFSFPLLLLVVSIMLISLMTWRSFPNGGHVRKDSRSLGLTKSEEHEWTIAFHHQRKTKCYIPRIMPASALGGPTVILSSPPVLGGKLPRR